MFCLEVMNDHIYFTAVYCTMGSLLLCHMDSLIDQTVAIFHSWHMEMKYEGNDRAATFIFK